MPGLVVPRPAGAFACGAGASEHAAHTVGDLDDLEPASLGHGEPHAGRLALSTRCAYDMAHRGTGVRGTPQRHRGLLGRVGGAWCGAVFSSACAWSGLLLRPYAPA